MIRNGEIPMLIESRAILNVIVLSVYVHVLHLKHCRENAVA